MALEMMILVRYGRSEAQVMTLAEKLLPELSGRMPFIITSPVKDATTTARILASVLAFGDSPEEVRTLSFYMLPAPTKSSVIEAYQAMRDHPNPAPCLIAVSDALWVERIPYGADEEGLCTWLEPVIAPAGAVVIDYVQRKVKVI